MRILPLEEIIGLDGGAGHAEERSADVLLQIGIIVEMVVGGGVPHERLHPVEEPVMLPGDQALVVQAVGKIGGLQDARGVLEDAVLDVLEAVLDLLDGVLAVEELRDFLLVVVALALGLGKTVVPGAELLGRDEGGIQPIQGVDARPVQAVAGRLQGIDDDPVGKGVLDGYVVLI